VSTKKSLFALRIQALALFAVFLFNWLLECFLAAITAVVITTTVVVVVVTVSIAFVAFRTTSPFAVATRLGLRVQAFAYFAVFLINRLFFGCFLAAITAVVLATTVVVFVVTVAIAFVALVLTSPFAVRTSLILRVQAFAFFAVFLINRLP